MVSFGNCFLPALFFPLLEPAETLAHLLVYKTVFHTGRNTRIITNYSLEPRLKAVRYVSSSDISCGREAEVSVAMCQLETSINLSGGIWVMCARCLSFPICNIHLTRTLVFS